MNSQRETYRQRNACHRMCPNCGRGGALKIELNIAERARVQSCRWCGFTRTRGLAIDGAAREWIVEYAGDQAGRKVRA